MLLNSDTDGKSLNKSKSNLWYYFAGFNFDLVSLFLPYLAHWNKIMDIFLYCMSRKIPLILIISAEEVEIS